MSFTKCFSVPTQILSPSGKLQAYSRSSSVCMWHRSLKPLKCCSPLKQVPRSIPKSHSGSGYIGPLPPSVLRVRLADYTERHSPHDRGALSPSTSPSRGKPQENHTPRV